MTIILTLNNRIKRIIYILKEADDFIPTAKIAKALNVSNKTIRRDLKKIEKYLSKENTKLIKKPRLGIKLCLYETDNTGLWEKLAKKEHFKKIKAKTRQNLIIHQILSQEYLDQDYILDQFNISISTYYNDLKTIKLNLKKYNLKLKISKEEQILIEGNELNLRVLSANTIINLLSKDDKEDIIYLLNNKSSILTDDIKYLKNCCPDLELIEFRKAAAIIDEKTDVDFTSNFLLYFIIYSAVSFTRIKSGKYLNIYLQKQDYSNLKYKKSYKTAKKIVKEIENRFEMKLNDDEIFAYLLQIWINSSVLESSNYSSDDFIDKITSTSYKIIDLFNKNLNIYIYNEKKFLLELNAYLRSLLIKKEFNLPNNYNLRISDFEINMLKIKNPYIFTLTKLVINLIKDNLNIEIAEIEVYYIALLFLTELEKQKHNLKVLIIHDNSNPIRNLIEVRLARNFSNYKFDFLKYSKIFNLNKEKQENYDLYLSTKTFEEFPQALVISPIITKVDINKIKDKIKILEDLQNYK
ncbi:MAG: BglG family transcription antiterminator [Halanaerobium sp.]